MWYLGTWDLVCSDRKYSLLGQTRSPSNPANFFPIVGRPIPLEDQTNRVKRPSPSPYASSQYSYSECAPSACGSPFTHHGKEPLMTSPYRDQLTPLLKLSKAHGHHYALWQRTPQFKYSSIKEVFPSVYAKNISQQLYQVLSSCCIMGEREKITFTTPCIIL